jgi:hypothetical protein
VFVLGSRANGRLASLSDVMEDDDAVLNALMLWRSNGHCAYCALAFVRFDPVADVLIHQGAHFGGPSLDTGSGGFAVRQGDDKLGALAVRNIEHAGFPGVERWASGLAWERFVLRMVSERGASLARCTLLLVAYAGLPLSSCDARF